MFRSGAQIAFLVLLVGLFLMRESQQEFGNAIDESFADFLARNSQRKEEAAPLTLVEINEASLKDHPWPWSPLDFALFFQAANTFRPEVLAVEEVLRWGEAQGAGDPTQKLPQYKKILREHVLRSSKVLLGAQLGYPEDPQVIPPLEEAPVIRRVTGDVEGIREFTTIAAQAEEDFRLSATTGFTNLNGGRYVQHSVPLLLRYRGQIVPSFVLQAVLLWEKLTADDVAVEAGVRVTLGDRVQIPIDARGRMRVDFGVPRNRCGLDELVLASAQADAKRQPVVPPEMLTGRLVILARTDRPARTLPFAIGRNGSPGELFAAGIATIQNRSFPKRAPFWVDAAVLAVAVVASVFLPRLRRMTAAFLIFIALALYVLAALGIFGRNLTWAPIVLPLGLAAVMVIWRALSADLPRRRRERRGQ